MSPAEMIEQAKQWARDCQNGDACIDSSCQYGKHINRLEKRLQAAMEVVQAVRQMRIQDPIGPMDAAQAMQRCFDALREFESANG